MNEREISNFIKDNNKVVVIIGLEFKDDNFIKQSECFIKENFNITREEFRKKMGFEDRTKFYPILEKEFERDFPFLYLNIKQIRRVPIFQKIKNDICLTPVNIFIKNNEILPIKYDKDRKYNEFKEILEDFKNKI